MTKLTGILFSLLIVHQLCSQEIIIQPPVFSDYGCTEFFQLYTGLVTNFAQKEFTADLYLQVDYTSPAGRTGRLAEGILTQPNGITFSPGVTAVDNASYESILPIRNITFFNKEIEDLLRRTKCLPPGSYEVCLTLYDHNDPSRQQFLTQTCYVREKEMLSPILLVSPFDMDTVNLDLPLFTWTAVTPFNMNAMYRIQLVEVLVNQTPFEAFRSNPIFYQTTGLKTNIFQYAIAARPMPQCMTYAWRVTYELEGRFTGTVFNRNPDFLQQSEIWTFLTECDEDDEEEETLEDSEIRLFYKPSNSRASQYYQHLGKHFRFEIDNPYKDLKSLQVLIESEDGEISSYSCCDCWDCGIESSDDKISNAEGSVKTGKNYMYIDLESYGLVKGKNYTMIFPDFKNDLFINFKYLEDEK